MRIGNDTEYEAIDPGVYPAELIEITDTKADGTPLMSNAAYGDPKPQWKFKFEIVDTAGLEGRQLSAWINKPNDMFNVSPKSNLVLIAQALIPDLSPADEWDLPDLLHQRCRIQVEGTKKADGTEGTKIGKYYPIKKADTVAAPAPAPAKVPSLAERRAAAAREPVAAGRVDPADAPF